MNKTTSNYNQAKQTKSRPLNKTRLLNHITPYAILIGLLINQKNHASELVPSAADTNTQTTLPDNETSEHTHAHAQNTRVTMHEVHIDLIEPTVQHLTTALSTEHEITASQIDNEQTIDSPQTIEDEANTQPLTHSNTEHLLEAAETTEETPDENDSSNAIYFGIAITALAGMITSLGLSNNSNHADNFIYLNTNESENDTTNADNTATDDIETETAAPATDEDNINETATESIDAETATPENPLTIEWEKTISSSYLSDWGTSIDMDNNDYLYVTYSGTEKQESSMSHAFLKKYNTDGDLQWAQQTNEEASITASSIAVDNNKVLISGYTDGPISGAISQGSKDVITIEYNPEGKLIELEQFETEFSNKAYDVTLDSLGNAFIAGILEKNDEPLNESFLMKIDTNQKHSSIPTVEGENAYFGLGLTTDSANNLYTTGVVHVNPDNLSSDEFDFMVKKYDSNGDLIWTHQTGSEHMDISFNIVTDSKSNVYISGSTNGNMQEGSQAANNYFNPVVIKISADGTQEWVQQFNVKTHEEVPFHPLAIDSEDNLYISSHSLDTESLMNQMGSFSDIFLAKISPDGTTLWQQTYDSDTTHVAFDMTIDSHDSIYITGQASQTQQNENFDAFLMKLSHEEDHTDDDFFS